MHIVLLLCELEPIPDYLLNVNNDLEKAWQYLRNWELFVLGDFNAVLGKASNIGFDNIFEHIGSYGHGFIIESGQILLKFMMNNILICLQHSIYTYYSPCHHIYYVY